MEKYLNEYTDQAAYEADEARKALTSSTISLVGDELVYDGINVEVTAPDMGDAVYHDADKKVHFIKFGTLDTSLIPTDFVPIGVCGPRMGENIYIVSGENASRRFATYFKWKVTDWNLDGQPHECTVKTYDGNWATTFTYTASTIEECSEQLNTYLAANAPEGKRFVTRIEDGIVRVVLLDYNSWKDYSFSITTVTVVIETCADIPLAPRPKMDAGNCYGVWNLERATEYFRADINSTTYNPANPISSAPTYPVCLPAYLGESQYRDGDKCAGLRAKFGEGEEGWLNYMSQLVPYIPYPKGLMADTYGTGKKNTYALAGQTSLNENNEPTALYPAADYCAGIGFDGVAGLEKGDWFGPSPMDFCYVFGKVRYGLSGVAVAESDPINITLSAMGLQTVSCAAVSWLFSRSYVYSCWDASSTGIVDGYSFYNSLRVVPLALYPLNNI